MSKKITLVTLLSVMLVATTLIVWDAAALGAADVSELGPVCAFVSASPCPTDNDCGYQFNGTCCVAKCKPCLGICFADVLRRSP